LWQSFDENRSEMIISADLCSSSIYSNELHVFIRIYFGSFYRIPNRRVKTVKL